MRKDVLTDLSKDCLINANLENRNEFLKTLLNYEKQEYKNKSDLKWIYSGFKNILMFDFNTDFNTVKKTINNLKEEYAGEIGAICCLLHEYSQPSDLKRLLLEENSFVHANDLYGMWLNLSNKSFESEPSTGFVIDKVNDVNGLETWSEIVCEGFGITSLFDSFHKAMIGSIDKYQHYIGYWNNEPVATLSVLNAKGVSGIYWVTTMKKVRNKGFATQMVKKALEDAKDLGYQVSILQSSKMAHKLYKELGFKDCYTEHSIEWYPNNK